MDSPESYPPMEANRFGRTETLVTRWQSASKLLGAKVGTEVEPWSPESGAQFGLLARNAYRFAKGPWVLPINSITPPFNLAVTEFPSLLVSLQSPSSP